MSMLLIHPPYQAKISGGNIFNQHIIQQALENNYPLVSLPSTDIQLNAELAAKIASLKPRLVIWDSLFFDSPGRLGFKSLAFTTALLVHYLPSQNPGLDSKSRTELKQLEHKAIRDCERIICTGSTIYRTLSFEFPKMPVFLCRPGVADFFQPAPEETLKARQKEAIDLITVANLLPDKGYPDLLEALSCIKTQPWTWHIVGSHWIDRSFRALFRSSALARNLLPRIRLHGVMSQKELAVLLSEMDLFISASRYESYGMAVAEAVAAGLPVVSTLTGDAAELIRDGQSGFLVPAGNLNALRKALQELIRDSELRNRFRLVSRTRPKLSWKSCFEDFKLACDFI